MENQVIDKGKRELIEYMLINGENFELKSLIPLSIGAKAVSDVEALCKIRQKLIDRGEFTAVQKLISFLNSEPYGLTAAEIKKIIKTAWRKHDVDTALKAIPLLLKKSPTSGQEAIKNALKKCLHFSQSGEHYFRPRYQVAIPKIMEMADQAGK